MGKFNPKMRRWRFDLLKERKYTEQDPANCNEKRLATVEFQAAAGAVGPPTVKVRSVVGRVFYFEPCACWLAEEPAGGKDCVRRNPCESVPLR